MIAEIFSGERDTSDIFLLVAVFLFVIAALLSWRPLPSVPVAAGAVTALGLGCVAFALMLL